MTIYRATEIANAYFGVPPVSGLIPDNLTVTETVSPTEVKDSVGNVVAVAVPESVLEISVSGLRTGTFAATVGSTLAITMPESIDLGATTIVTGNTTTFAGEQFERIDMTARSYKTAMTASAA